MISILIPSYNYNTLPLVEDLYEQVRLEAIEFEIIVADDAAPENEITAINTKINELDCCQFIRNPTNLGRGQNRNQLVRIAKYDWILFLDCDTIPQSKNFIKLYIDSIKQKTVQAVFGGIIYDKKRPIDDEMLRWVFGKSREEIRLEKRKSAPFHYTLISNILIEKKILKSHPFSSKLVNYGYEDIAFVLELKRNKISISHIENPVFHLNLEKSAVFLEKYHSSLENLKLAIDNDIISAEDTSLTRLYMKLKNLRLLRFSVFLFNCFKKLITKNLISKNPSLFLFDLYRLGYFCHINLR